MIGPSALDREATVIGSYAADVSAAAMIGASAPGREATALFGTSAADGEAAAKAAPRQAAVRSKLAMLLNLILVGNPRAMHAVPAPY
jgi:hypothetical protein